MSISECDAMILGFLARGSGDEGNLLSNLTEGVPTEIGRAIIILRNNKKRVKDIAKDCYDAAQALIDNVERQRQGARAMEQRRQIRKELDAATEKIAKKHKVKIRLLRYIVNEVEFVN